MTSKTAAIRYARALFDVALQEKADLARIETELAGVNALFEKEPTLKKVMLNPAVPVPRKRAAMVELTTHAKTSTMVGKLLVLLAERDRLTLLPDLLASYRERMLDHQKIVRAEVITATAIDDDTQQTIQTTLAAITGRTVTVVSKMDPAIIGGLVARVGGTVYDGSIATQLQKLKQRLVERA